MIRTRLYKHQLTNLKFHLARDRSADWSQMGVGKSCIALSKIDILKSKGIVKSALIICPRSVMVTWAAEITKHSDLTFILLDGSLENKIKLLANNFDIYIISYDSIPGRKKTSGIILDILLRKGFGIVILDEITHVKNFNAIRTKTVTFLCNKVNRVLALSGTPITNNLESTITIYNCVDGGQTFGKNYFSARNYFFNNHGYGFPDWHLREDKQDEFKRRLFFNAVRLLKENCLDLPKKIFTERYVELDGITKTIYHKIANELLQELKLPEGKVKIRNSLVRLAKLSQLTSGFLYTDKNIQLFPSNPKLELLHEVIEEIPESDKIIIFCRWTQDIKNISKFLDENHISYTVLQGDTHDRATPIKDFNNPTKAKILLAQITVGAYGLNLTCSSTIIYFSLGFSVLEYLQSQDRIHRIGQTKPCVYVNLIVKNTIDEYIYKCLQKKIDISKSLIDDNQLNILKENLENSIL